MEGGLGSQGRIDAPACGGAPLMGRSCSWEACPSGERPSGGPWRGPPTSGTTEPQRAWRGSPTLGKVWKWMPRRHEWDKL